ncbi:MAG: MFS transporter [Gammaproteobacteria bacterium]|jgi:DHA1 family tetracycline resistance protein-like MFS transporter
MAYNYSKTLPLLFLIFIDQLSFTILIPVLSSFFNTTIEAHLVINYLLYSITLAIFPILMFFSAPIMGDLSDKFERKSILLISLFGTLFGYMLISIGILKHNYITIILGRIINGLTAGSIPIAQAAIIDFSSEKNRVYLLSLATLSGTIGVIAGPLIGGYFSDHTISKWFGNYLPIVIAIFLTLLNIIFLSIYFPKKSTKNVCDDPVRILTSLKNNIKTLYHKSIRDLSLLFVLFQLAWGVFFVYYAFYLIYYYKFSSLNVGIMYGYIGVCSTAAIFVIIKPLHNICSNKKLAIFSLTTMGLFQILMGIQMHGIWHWLCVAFIAFGNTIAYPTLLNLFSARKHPSQQGHIMGLTSALTAIAFALTPLISSAFAHINPSAPFFASGIIIFISLFTYAILGRN